MSGILLFATDIEEICSNCEVHKVLEKHNEIKQWSIDTDDAEHVLRVVSDTLTPAEVIALLNKLGHTCSELN